MHLYLYENVCLLNVHIIRCPGLTLQENREQYFTTNQEHISIDNLYPFCPTYDAFYFSISLHKGIAHINKNWKYF